MKWLGDIYLEQNFGIARTRYLVEIHNVRAPESWSKYTTLQWILLCVTKLKKMSLTKFVDSRTWGAAQHSGLRSSLPLKRSADRIPEGDNKYEKKICWLWYLNKKIEMINLEKHSVQFHFFVHPWRMLKQPGLTSLDLHLLVI